MKFTYILSVLGLASSVLAAPSAVRRDWSSCLAQSDAQSLVDQYISILTHSDVTTANATAQAILADDYQEISDSILSLEGQPLGGVTFAGKQVYINGVLNAPPVAGVNTIAVYVVGCDKILWQWNFTGIGSAQYEIKGFNLFHLNSAGQIETVELEFNSIAWGLDTGYQIIFPPNPAPTK